MNGTPNLGYSDMAALYARRPLYLWVEDLTTYTYLDACWNDPQIGFYIAASSLAVNRVVTDTQCDGHRHVFGLVDRDYGATNRHQWLTPNGPTVFRLEVNEIENHLLDPTQLARCAMNTANRSETDILVRLLRKGKELCWWNALRAVHVKIRHMALNDFPNQPMVRSLEEATRNIVESPWFRSQYANAHRMTEEFITQLLADAHAEYEAHLNDSRYLHTFSGKELLRDLHTYLIDTKNVPYQKATERDQELAKAIAEVQRDMNTIPAEITELRAALRQRVSL